MERKHRKIIAIIYAIVILFVLMNGVIGYCLTGTYEHDGKYMIMGMIWAVFWLFILSLGVDIIYPEVEIGVLFISE